MVPIAPTTECAPNACMRVKHTRRTVMNRWQPLLLALTLVGCSTSPEQMADEPADADGRICISVRSINSFDAIDDRHVYLKAAGKKHYLFTLWGGCVGLRSAHTIAVKDTFSRVCSDGFGEIAYRDMGRLQSCRIDTIEPVASKDDAKGLVNDRKEAKSDD